MSFFNPFIDASGSSGGETGKDGRGISSIVFSSSTLGSVAGIEGAIDTYKINYTDETSSTFEVKNGERGSTGPQGEQGLQGEVGPIGEQGFSPQIAVASRANTWKITSANSNAIFDNNNFDKYFTTGIDRIIVVPRKINSSTTCSLKITAYSRTGIIVSQYEKTLNINEGIIIEPVGEGSIQIEESSGLLVSGDIIWFTEYNTYPSDLGGKDYYLCIKTNDEDSDIFNIVSKNLHGKDGTSSSETIDLSGYAKKEDLVGQKTTDGGEIFNDYGNNTAAPNSHAEGRNTTASGNYSHAEGNSTTASGHSSHSEGGSTTASGSCSHAEGASTIASGNYSHAEGVSTTALGNYSHAEGLNAIASGAFSHTEGRGTKASSDYQHVQGKFNTEDAESKFAFIIGNGTNDSERSNAIAIDWNGLIYLNNSETGIDLTSLKGDTGSDGRGITSATINLSGELIINYSDGTSENLGNITGLQGEQGPQGEKGDTGVGIESITFKNSSSGVSAAQPGAIDTYTITYTDGSHTEFQIKNGEDGTPAIIDTEMSDTSENAVQNKVIKSYIDLTAGDINSILSTEIDSVNEDLNNLQDRTSELENKVELLVKKETKIYGFRINPNEADPYEAVVYLADAVGMTPAKMGAESFDYGSWRDAFFMPRPCMVKYDGTVDYYLNPNNYKEKEDGSASDVANADYEGNAMMEFPKIWYKFEEGSEEGEGYFYCSNVKPDDTYHCWCNINSNDEETDHFYMAIYNGTGTDRLRSLSGVQLTPANGNGNATGQQEVDRALRNNTTESVEWYTEVWSDRLLLTALHVLISKSLNTQGSFGQGISSGSQTTKEAYVTGALDDKGLFFGDTTGTATAVKTFGIENFWSLVWHRVAGCISVDNVLKTKLTYGKADGSDVIGYNSTGNGYITETGIPTLNGYASKMKFSERGFMTKEVAGSTNKFYCDIFFQSSGTRYLLVGGRSGYGPDAGAFCLSLTTAFSRAGWDFAASLSLKPLLEKGV